MTLSLTADQLVKAQAYAEAGNYAGGWAYLASIGDNYADKSGVVIDSRRNPSIRSNACGFARSTSWEA